MDKQEVELTPQQVIQTFNSPASQSSISSSPRRNWKYVGIIAVFFIVIGSILLSFSILPKERTKVPKAQPKLQINQLSRIDASDWKTYRNEEFGFELHYPPKWNHERFSGPDYTKEPILKFEFWNPDNKILAKDLSGKYTYEVSSANVYFRLEKIKRNNSDASIKIGDKNASVLQNQIIESDIGTKIQTEKSYIFEHNGFSITFAGDNPELDQVAATFKSIPIKAPPQTILVNNSKCKVFSGVSHPTKQDAWFLITEECKTRDGQYFIFKSESSNITPLRKEASQFLFWGPELISGTRIIDATFINDNEFIVTESFGEGGGCNSGGFIDSHVINFNTATSRKISRFDKSHSAHIFKPATSEEDFSCSECWDDHASLHVDGDTLVSFSLICSADEKTKTLTVEKNNKELLNKQYPADTDLSDILEFPEKENTVKILQNLNQLFFSVEGKGYTVDLKDNTLTPQ